ncbi:MAG: hypothetical protein GEU90_14670 [Gemmatimonas sp.]|nr:hypothetical protein [Gemmatimonas sp.]
MATRHPIRCIALAASSSLLFACEAERAPSPSLADASTCGIVESALSLPSGVDEASGVVMSRTTPGTLWIHNDSGNEPVLLAVDAAGRELGSVAVTNAENDDWEDIASGSCPAGECLYIADSGDNGADRSRIHLYRVPEPHPEDAATSPAERFDMVYPGGPRDAEALFLLPDERIFLVTKGSRTQIEVYAYPGPLRPGETVELQRVRALSTGPVPVMDLVTGAGANPAGSWVAIRTYTGVLLYRAEELLGTGGHSPIHAEIGSIGETQGEGVALGDNGTLVLVGEGGGGGFPGTLAILRCDLDTRTGSTPTGGSALQGSP